MKTVVLCFGNEFIKEDSRAKEIADEIKIKNVEFRKCDSLNDILLYSSHPHLFILDVVRNIQEVTLITDIDTLNTNDMYSLHDFDLGFFLKLMKKLGTLKNITIIGIPQKGDTHTIISRIKKIVTTQKV